MLSSNEMQATAAKSHARNVELAHAYDRLRKLALRLERLKSGASMHYTAAGHENGDPQAPLTRRERNAKRSLRSQQRVSRRANRG